MIQSVSLDQYIDTEKTKSEVWRDLFGRARALKPDREVAHTPREILQQPWTWFQSALLGAARFEMVEKLVQSSNRIFLTGAGSSALVGKSLDLMLASRLRKPAVSVSTTDLILAPELYLIKGEQGLLVSFSRSGESPESLQAIRLVRDQFPHYQHLLITCNPNGKLIDEFSGDPEMHILPLHPTACDRGLAMTSSFTSMLVLGQMLAFRGGAAEYLDHVRRLAEMGAELLQKAADLLKVISCPAPTRVCLLGSKVLRGAAEEGALKILEMTDGKVCTLAESYLGVRHGPLSFLDDSTLVVFLVSSQKCCRRYESDLLVEIGRKSLGMHRLGLGCEMDEKLRAGLDTHVDLKGLGRQCLEDDCRPPVDVLLPQLIALSLSLELGLDPDNPSPKGVIRRVVQGVNIYGEVS